MATLNSKILLASIASHTATHTHDTRNDITDIQTMLDTKQNTLTAGSNISIVGDTISATTDDINPYTFTTPLSESENNVTIDLSGKQDAITSSTGLQFLKGTVGNTATSAGNGELVVENAVKIGSTDVITEIGTKQDAITASTELQFLKGTVGNTETSAGNGELVVENALIVGSTDVITEIGTKQDAITSSTGLQFLKGTVGNTATSAGNGELVVENAVKIGSTDVITEIGTKQDAITASTELQFLKGTVGDIATSVGDGELVVKNALKIGSTDVITEIGTKQDILTAGDGIDITGTTISRNFNLSGISFGTSGSAAVDFDATHTSYFMDFLNSDSYIDSNYYQYTTPDPHTNSSNQGLKILVAGVYEICYVYTFKNVTFTDRVNTRVRIFKNETAIGPGQTHSYIRDDSFVVHTSNSATFCHNFSQNEWLKLHFSISKNDTNYGDNLDGLRQLANNTFSIKYLGQIPP